MRLMNPGPVTLTPRVKEAMLRQDMCHRQQEYSQLQAEVIRRLSRVYPEAAEDYAAVLFTGSGTAAVEAMVSSLVPHSGKALVVANGVYGERMAAMLEKLSRPFEIIQGDWIEPISLADVENCLKQDSEFTHVLTVHHETTTGRLNDMGELGRLCLRYGVGLLLDSVSSFGAQDIKFRDWGLEGLASTANKCLHGVPGISFVLVRKDILQTDNSFSAGLYLDLFSNFKAQSNGFPQFTPAIQALYALHEALIELEDGGGWPARYAHYSYLSKILREELNNRGIRLLLESANVYSPCLSSFILPPDLDYNHLYSHMKKRNFIIYAGQNMFQSLIFRTAVMGALTESDIRDFVRAFDEVTLSKSLSASQP